MLMRHAAGSPTTQVPPWASASAAGGQTNLDGAWALNKEPLNKAQRVRSKNPE